MEHLSSCNFCVIIKFEIFWTWVLLVLNKDAFLTLPRCQVKLKMRYTHKGNHKTIFVVTRNIFAWKNTSSTKLSDKKENWVTQQN